MSEWKPISSAPVNVRGLVWIADQFPYLSPIAFGCVREFVAYSPTGDGERTRYFSADGYNGDWKITHWMPLPTPPAPEQS